jgi:hypothetical protein
MIVAALAVAVRMLYPSYVDRRSPEPNNKVNFQKEIEYFLCDFVFTFGSFDLRI